MATVLIKNGRIVTAVAGLLAKVAYADGHYSELEEATIQKELSRVHGLSQAGVDAICGLLADQISHVALLGDHDWTRDLRELADRELRLEVLEVLIEIGKALTSTIDLEDVLAVIMDHVSHLLKTQAWSLLLRDESTGHLTFEIAVSPAAEKLKGMIVAPGEGIAGWVAEHGEPLVIADVNEDERFIGMYEFASWYQELLRKEGHE